MNEPLDLSVVIIAFNEEANLPRCLKSLPQNIEIIVLDSGSTDRTAAIAQEFGARVYQRAFTNFAEHKNAALAHATRRWVLAVDADEELDAGLRESIAEAIANPEAGVEAYRLQRRLVFMGRRMRFGKTRDWPVRLFLRSQGQYVGSIHEELKVPGRTARLSRDFFGTIATGTSATTSCGSTAIRARLQTVTWPKASGCPWRDIFCVPGWSFSHAMCFV